MLGLQPLRPHPPGSGHVTIHKADSEGSDQTVRMPSLILVFAWRTGHFVGFVVLYSSQTVSRLWRKNRQPCSYYSNPRGLFAITFHLLIFLLFLLHWNRS